MDRKTAKPSVTALSWKASSQETQSSGAPDEDKLTPRRGDSRAATKNVQPDTKRRGKEGKGKWFSQLKGWVSMSEPSTQALKKHRKITFKNAGVALDDPQANAKLHAPIGEIPAEAIRPTRGPNPEEVVKRRAEERRRGKSFSGADYASYRASQSRGTSHSASNSSVGKVDFTSFSWDK